MRCRPLTNEECELISKTFYGKHEKRNRALFWLGRATGFRITELLSLRVKDVFQGSKVTDRVSVQRKSMKSKKTSRTVKLHPRAQEALKAYIDEIADRGRLFDDAVLFSGKPTLDQPMTREHAYRVINRAAKENELEGTIGTHSMRKTFANSVFEASGRNLYLTQQALGHANVETTTLYLELGEDQIDEAVIGAF